MGVELAMEVVMGKKAIGGGRRASSARSMRGKERPEGVGQKAQGSNNHQETEPSGLRLQPQRRGGLLW